MALILFASLFKTIILKPELLKTKSFYLGKIDILIEFFTKINPLLCITLIGLFVLQIGLLAFISIKNIDTIGLSYMMEYYGLSLKLDLGNRSLMAITAVNALIIVNLFLLAIPSIFDFIFRKSSKIFNKEINSKPLKIILISLLTFLILFAGLADLSKAQSPLIIGLILLTYFVFIAEKSKIDLNNLFNKKEKILLISGLIILSILTISFSLYKNNRPINYAYNDFLNPREDIITLPREIKIEETQRFSEYEYKGKLDLFLDKYLIFHPNYQKIQYKNYSEFGENENDYAILFSENIKTVSEIVKNPNIISALSDTTFNEYIYINKEEIEFLNDYKMNITFDCQGNPEDNRIRWEYFDFIDEEVKTKTIIYFPGCNSSQQEKTFSILLTNDFYKIPKDEMLYKIPLNESFKITKIEIIDQNDNNIATNFKHFTNDPFSLISKNLGIQNEINVFNSFDSENFEVPITQNISENVNFILDKTNLSSKDTIILWSSSHNPFIKNEL